MGGEGVLKINNLKIKNLVSTLQYERRPSLAYYYVIVKRVLMLWALMGSRNKPVVKRQ